MDSDAYNVSDSEGSVNLYEIANEIVFETSESDRERINVDSNEMQAVIESPMEVDSDTSYVNDERTTDSTSSSYNNTSSGSSNMPFPIYVELDDPLINLSPGSENIDGLHHQLEVSDTHIACRICIFKNGMRKEVLTRCSTCRVHVCSQYHLRLWHNENGDPQLESPPIASRTRSKRQRITDQRAPIRGFTSDENEEFLDSPHQSYQAGMASHALLDSDTDTFENLEGPLTRRRILTRSEGPLTRRRILRPSRGLMSVKRPSTHTNSDISSQAGPSGYTNSDISSQAGPSGYTNSDISPQPGPSGYVPPDKNMFPSDSDSE